MSDLPRFHTGAAGRLDFTTLNEMMRRLDLLLPLIESASLQDSRTLKTKRPVFLVKAERVEGSSSRYAWREVVVSSGDQLLVETDPEWGELEEADIQFRSGGLPTEDKDDDSEERYAVLADPTAYFEEGLAICFALNRVDKVKRYVLVPFAVESGPAFFRVTGGGNTTSLNLGDELTVQAVIYNGEAYSPGAEGEEWTSTSATVYDLSKNEINEPNTNAPAVDINYQVLLPGTILTPNWVDADTGYFGACPRLSFNCKG